MTKSLDPFRFLLMAVAGWMNQQQLELIGASSIWHGQPEVKKYFRPAAAPPAS